MFAVGKVTPSSLRDLMVALMRLSCGSFWNSSAHSTIRAFSFSLTFGCTWGEEDEDGNHYQHLLYSETRICLNVYNYTNIYTASWSSLPCSTHYELHWQTPASRFLGERFFHCLKRRHLATKQGNYSNISTAIICLKYRFANLWTGLIDSLKYSIQTVTAHM